MSNNMLRDISDNVKAPFADADADDVVRIVDGLDENTKWDLAVVVNNADSSNLSDEGFAADMGCAVEVVARLRSFVWPATGA